MHTADRNPHAEPERASKPARSSRRSLRLAHRFQFPQPVKGSHGEESSLEPYPPSHHRASTATRPVLRLDHLTVVAPTLTHGVAHVRHCLDLDVPFGQRHAYMGTHNHVLQLGDSVYLEIVALDPDGKPPAVARWFGLDHAEAVMDDWDAGRRLRGWVASAESIDHVLAGRNRVFGTKISLPWVEPRFDFSLMHEGRLPLDGAAPSIIDRRGMRRSMATMADLGARLRTFSLAHPNPAGIAALYEEFAIDRAPTIGPGCDLRYRAQIETPAGIRELY